MSACNKILGVYVDKNLLWSDQFHHILKYTVIICMAFKQDTFLFVNRS